MGPDGARVVIVNSVGREIDVLGDDEPVEGRASSSPSTPTSSARPRRGSASPATTASAVMLDPRNGEVLALASVPAFDPNDFASGIAARTWGRLLTDPLRPLKNRAIQGRYSPGSVVQDRGRGGRSRGRA